MTIWCSHKVVLIYVITTCTSIKDIKIMRYFMIHYETELHWVPGRWSLPLGCKPTPRRRGEPVASGTWVSSMTTVFSGLWCWFVHTCSIFSFFWHSTARPDELRKQDKWYQQVFCLWMWNSWWKLLQDSRACWKTQTYCSETMQLPHASCQ